KEDEFQLYQRLFHIINPHLPKPDLLVYLHKDVPKLKENIRNRGRDYEQNIQDDYLGNLEKGYWDFFKQQDGMRIVVLDTNEVDFVRNMNDYNRILEILQQDFPVGLHRILPKG
ncbi:MAG TPA: deoxynucleoside kinase, partial [Bacteroidia bacterium]|nr:deoxynucleoside kinase [Bacteroidia bacterium]